jgi:hypothetical protein
MRHRMHTLAAAFPCEASAWRRRRAAWACLSIPARVAARETAPQRTYFPGCAAVFRIGAQRATSALT